MRKKLLMLVVSTIVMVLARGAIADESASDSASQGAATASASATAGPAEISAGSAVQPSVAAAETLSLADLFSQAFANSPRIREAKAQWQASVETYPQAKSWPDPSAEFKWFPGSGSYEVDLMQMVPNPRRTGLQGNLALSKAQIAQVSYEKTVRDVLVDVMRSYYELGYLSRAAQIAQTNKDLFSQIVDLAGVGYAQGTLGVSEKSTAESRLAQAGYELQLLQEQLYTEQANMRSVLGLSPDAPIGEVVLPSADPVQLDLDQIRAQVNEHRQELEMAGLSIDAATADLSLARALGSPDFSFGLMFESMAGQSMGTDAVGEPLGPSRDNNLGITFGVTIPLWGGKNNARVAQAQAELEAAQADLERQTSQAMAASDKLYYQIQNLNRLVVLYRDTLIPQTTQAADLAQTWYESGTNSFTDLIESRLVLENFQLAGTRAQADYLIALAELQRLAGAPIESAGNANSESQEAIQ